MIVSGFLKRYFRRILVGKWMRSGDMFISRIDFPLVKCDNLWDCRYFTSRTSLDIENSIMTKLQNMSSERISYGIKKSVKYGFISKRMFDLYGELVKKYHTSFRLSDVILILQSYALCKERNFEVYTLLSNRTLCMFKEKQKMLGEEASGEEALDVEAPGEEALDYIYKFILASNKLNFSDYELMTIFMKEIKKNVTYYGLKKISNLLHALVKLKCIDDELLGIANRYILLNFHNMKCNYVNHFISAYSKKSNNTYAELCFKLVKYIYENAKSMDSISIYNTLIQMSAILEKIRHDEAFRIYFSEGNMQTMLTPPNVENCGRSHCGGDDYRSSDYRRSDDYPRSDYHRSDDYPRSDGEWCYLGGEETHTEERDCHKYNGKVLKNIVPLLFSRVNSCLAFLSLKQLIKLICAYKELNYFNYTFIYKRLLHFLLCKMQTTKININEAILILEFFTLLPYIDNNMDEIIQIVTQHLGKNIVFNYSHICRLLFSCKKLQIYNDNILSRVEDLIYKNKKSFENECNLDDFPIFLHFYNRNEEEWGEIIRFLDSLMRKKTAMGEAVGTNGQGIASQNEEGNNRDPLAPSCKAERRVIVYKYNKADGRISEEEVSVGGGPATSTSAATSTATSTSTTGGHDGAVAFEGKIFPEEKNATEVGKRISAYLYFNLEADKKSN
ncbi:conserved Plasmodium protein, unknown function [Plasmodium ovale wallikeri]|uniref:Uncharacterized protein n=2 Tax=Plasmodium ovale TaxID=36330 RepID=A0A1A8YM86_PLAOA|nr:conserved Plasmodium protein, unknown function [Plasmodium ovale wallikeri]SBT33172.1 conserved Plasmodium protein, unknown function [Plasmodium ovale wallikeri]SBT76022.1 conserved Plasmodium protein, unknown function [Plasmodium ovale]